MPELRVNAAGAIGIIKDVPSHMLPPNGWDEGQNVIMEELQVQKAKGYQTTFTGIPTISPTFLLPMTTATSQFWVYLNNAKAKVTDGATETDITRVSGDFNADYTDNKWTGTMFGQVAILNNPVDGPYQWNLSPGSPLAALSNWPPPHLSTLTCKWMRGFNRFLIAGNLTEDGTDYPQQIRWSSIADPGTVPNSWDETDPTVEAGTLPLVETGGRIMDGWPNGQVFIVFKEDSLIRLEYIGGLYVFRNRTYSTEFGVFARNCVAPFAPGQLAAFGYEDIVRTNGNQVDSIIDARLRRWLFNAIDGDNLEMCWAARNREDNEVWFAFPETGSQFPNLALVWNHKENVWGVRDIPDSLHGANGVLDSTTSGAPSYDATAVAYDGYGASYGLQTYNPATQRFALAGSNATKIYEAAQGYTADGAEYTASIRRTQFPFFPGRDGTPVYDVKQQKLITQFTPWLTGSGDVNIYIGGSERIDQSPSWTGPFPFTIGVTEFITPFVSHRIPAIRIESTGAGNWKMSGYSMEMVEVGSKF